MIVILIMLFGAMIVSLKIHRQGLDKEYLSKENTQAIKGIFTIIVFLSHVRTYAEYSHVTDLFVIDFLNYLGQLMVAMFLFYSGYGISESIKRKGYMYVQSMPRNRIGKTFFDFALAICIFLLVNPFIGAKYSLVDIILSFTGWTTVGNSNWYMFAIFTLYILTFLCFLLWKNNRWIALVSMTICSLGYVYIMSLLKENWWSSTYLCYSAGMWYSYYKDKIDKVLGKSNIIYYAVTIGCIICYGYMFQFRYVRLLLFNAVAILFSLVIVLISMKISFKSKILVWCGKYLFWIYILQRIPMRIFAHIGVNEYNPYIYLFLCFLVTLVLAVVVNKGADELKKKIWM